MCHCGKGTEEVAIGNQFETEKAEKVLNCICVFVGAIWGEIS